LSCCESWLQSYDQSQAKCNQNENSQSIRSVTKKARFKVCSTSLKIMIPSGKGTAPNKTKTMMLDRISRSFPVEPWTADPPFDTLIQTILSQNTSDRNSDAAMKMLRKRYKIKPRSLANAKIRELTPCIRSAGLYRSKAPHIIETSRIIWKQYKGSLNSILKLPYPDAKEKLMAFPGVGPKTADIVLAFNAKHPVIPVDTHIARVTKRLGIVPQNANYEKIRTSLEALIPETDRIAVHLSIIQFGREMCKAPRPKCQICPVNKSCPSSLL
jgi:endonuclease-3